MFKNMRLVIHFHIFLEPRFKMTTIFANVPRTGATISKFKYKKRFQITRNVVKKHMSF